MGLSLFVAASVGVALSHSIQILIALRLVQAFGGAAGLVLARAIARRGFDTREATHRLALMNLIITLGPAIAPVIGSVIASMLGWRAIFGAAALMGILNLVGTWRHVRPPDRMPAATNSILSDYLRLFVTPAFVGYSLAGAGLTTSMYALLGTAPFILIGRFGLPVEQIGPLLASATIGIWLGSVAASKLVRMIEADFLLFLGGGCVSAASFALLALVLSGHLGIVSFVADMALFLFGVGLSGPPALALAIGANPLAIASGAGAYGAFQMAVGALCSFCAALTPDPALGAAITISVAATLGAASLYLAYGVQRA